jgi:CubicO group peptidase (beta-lactamase class C family)
MKRKTLSLLALLAMLLSTAACGEDLTPEVTKTATPTEVVAAQAQAVFAYATAESQDVSAEALQQLADEVKGYFDNGLIVGAELAVIKNRHVVLHEAIGWQDREDEVPMERNALFNIRSMTKPVVGTVTQMLIDEGKLALDDRVADYLSSFDNDKSRWITIEHLLTHRSGLPLTLLENWPNYESLQEIADQAGEHGPDFPVGSRFYYSDSGSDTLGAVLEKASGMSLGALLEQRILAPLGMTDTVTLIDPDDPRTVRICSIYRGSKGSWSRIWSPGDEPVYPFTMGSQSLYSTPLDYARFLALWIDGGTVGGDQRLLSPEAVERALEPVSEMKQLGSDADYPTEFPGLDVYYGQMWELHLETGAPDGKPVIFGHSGSDGTAAWVWPDLDLIVLYFTQSRGGLTVLRLEEVIDSLLIHPGAGQELADVPAELQPYLGTYTGLSGPVRYQEYTVVVRDGHLAVEIPEGLVVDLEKADEEGKWYFIIDPSVKVSFEQDEAGNAVVMKMHFPDETFELPRGTAPPEPELDLEAVQEYLGFYRLEEDDRIVEIVIHNGHLAIEVPGTVVPLELYAPDEEDKWALRLNPAVSISFQDSADGQIVSFTSHTPEGDFIRSRVEPEDVGQ